MIKTKNDLHTYITADAKANPCNISLIKKMLGVKNEKYMVRKLLYYLRYTEYYHNKDHQNLVSRILYHYYNWKLNKLSFKMQIYIPINTIGKGLKIAHYKGGLEFNCLSMGDYCIVNSGAMIGNKNGDENRATIGNHVEITLGAKIIGKVTIGDYNSVVIKDVPPYGVVSGVPAKIIKMNTPTSSN